MPEVTIQQAMQMAVRLHQSGRLSQAEQIYRQILQQQPNHRDALHYLGIIYGESGQYQLAIELIGKALLAHPGTAELHCSIGGYYARWGKLDEAVASLRRAIELRKDCPDAHSNLGATLKLKGELDQAIIVLRQGLEFNGNDADTHFNLGTTLLEKQQLDEAIAEFRRTLELQESHLSARNNLGSTLSLQGRLEEAVTCYDQLMAMAPADPEFHSSRLFMSHFLPSYDAARVLKEHQQWDTRHALPLRPFIQPHINDRSPDRQLKIGYLSPDLRLHSVAFFLLPLLETHDRRQFHITCYANSTKVDDITSRMQRCTDAWCVIKEFSDEQAAARIRQDGIDILIDLAGHTAGARPLVFARKPAPIQVNYLGYPGTTGIATIDYRLSDALADPPTTSDLNATEKIVRISKCAWCFTPLLGSPNISNLPAPKDHGVTFGSFNNFAKAAPDILALWAQILAQSPHSRLLLKNQAMRSMSVINQLRKFFEAREISPDRLQCIPHQPNLLEHLQQYQQVDIALDTFPYHGTTTTCEALWMGVPVVTMAGHSHASRVGVSLLSNIGLPELIAHTPEEYVNIAITLASDPTRLAHLRSTLRNQMQASPLMNQKGFAADVEAAYRSMWQKWCVTPQKSFA